MDPAAVVVEALAAGASTGLGTTASEAVTDAYRGLRELLSRRLNGRRRVLNHLDAVETGSGVWSAELRTELTDSGAVDARVLDLARRLLALADPAGSRSGKYDVEINDAKGLQVGDGNVQHNTFQ